MDDENDFDWLFRSSISIDTSAHYLSKEEEPLGLYYEDEVTDITDPDYICSISGIELMMNKLLDRQNKSDDKPRTEVALIPSDDLSATMNCSPKLQPPRPRALLRPKSQVKIGTLWQFIADLLYNGEFNPRVVCWEDFENGAFRIVNCDEIARIWAEKRKVRNTMCFAKFRRAMRFFTKKKILEPCPKRLVYRFGPNAKGWKRLNSSKTVKIWN